MGIIEAWFAWRLMTRQWGIDDCVDGRGGWEDGMGRVNASAWRSDGAWASKGRDEDLDFAGTGSGVPCILAFALDESWGVMDVSKLSCRITQVYIVGLSLLWVGPTHMNHINATEFDTASSS
jgi:hypothetical protein